MNRLVIVGAGGHGKVIADCAVKNGYSDICFVDDNAVGECLGFPVLGTISSINQLNDGKTDFIIGIGNNIVRKTISETYDINWASLVHPSAQIAFNVNIGEGTVVFANAVINASTLIGRHCIINSGAIIEHDNIIENYAHISPGAKLGGTVSVGELTHIGIGATLRNNISICRNCIIGAGAVVVSDIKTCGTYIGVPVKKYNS